MRAISGLLQPREGRIVLDGELTDRVKAFAPNHPLADFVGAVLERRDGVGYAVGETLVVYSSPADRYDRLVPRTAVRHQQPLGDEALDQLAGALTGLERHLVPSLWTQFDWEYEFWEANLSADCPPAEIPETGTTLYRISHPEGQPQRFSTATVTAGGTTCTGWPRPSFVYSTHVIGTPAGGSSGSPVFTNEGVIVGQLAGACGIDGLAGTVGLLVHDDGEVGHHPGR